MALSHRAIAGQSATGPATLIIAGLAVGMQSTYLPILGICYGLQLIGHLFQGKVHKSNKREYGFAELVVDKKCDSFKRAVFLH